MMEAEGAAAAAAATKIASTPTSRLLGLTFCPLKYFSVKMAKKKP